MTDYKELYHLLFNKITDAIDELQQIQITSEQLYIDSDLDKDDAETK